MECCYLVSWGVEDSSPFPSLEHLNLERMSYLMEIPEEFEDSYSLKSIKVDCCPESVLISAEKILKQQQDMANDRFTVEVVHPSWVFMMERRKEMPNLNVKYRENLLSEAEKELYLLETDVDCLKGYIKNAYKMHKKDQIFKLFEKSLREVLYDADYTIDSEVIFKVGKSHLWRRITGGVDGTLLNFVRGHAKSLCDKVKVYLPSIATAEGSADATTSETRDSRQQKRRKHIVGFEDEVDTLISYVNQESNALQVVTIVGLPGLGKTTVAWKIFKDERIEYEFHTRIWVNISQDFQMKNVLITILRHFTEPNPKMDVEELTGAVKAHLGKGKFLIIMDDLWTTGAWDEIKGFLPVNNNSSRVLITSRHKNVAYHANPMRAPHELRFLRPEESWELLQYELYGQLDVVDKELVQVGHIIANLCEGLPLSLIVIGGILADKMSMAEDSVFQIKKEWENISKSIETNLVYADLNERLEKIITLGFDNLPFELRDCFMYLGAFPEDANIPTRRLTLL